MRTINPPFPPTIYEAYELDREDNRWRSADGGYWFFLGSCVYNLVSDGSYDWIIRRTDFCPETGQIVASFFVSRDDAMKAGEEFCVKHDITIPDFLRTGKYDTPEQAR